ncbi:ATP-dependent DNA ligase [Caldiplasma sukawensis]
MLFSNFSDLLNQLENMTKRLDMVDLIADFLGKDQESDTMALYMMQGKLRPDYEGIETGISEKSIVSCLMNVANLKENEFIKIYKDKGDLGNTVEYFIRERKSQLTLFSEPLMVKEVYEELMRMAKTKGHGSAEEKEKIFSHLLSRADPLEARYLTRIVTGKMRVGVSDSTILNALNKKFREGLNFDDLENYYNFYPDIGNLYRILTNYPEEIKNASPRPLIPFKVMLAERLSTIAEIIEKMEGQTAFEYKYDGLRIQIHKEGENLKTFSRGNEDTTDQFPEIKSAFLSLNNKSFILDGEAVPYNPETGELYPFQKVSRRRGRKYGISREEGQFYLYEEEKKNISRNLISEEIPLCVFLFDIIYFEGKPLNNLPYEERSKILRENFRETNLLKFASRLESNDADQVEKFFENAISDGCEGLVAKNTGPESVYRAGARGWLWIKLKRDYQNELADTLDLVVIGAFYGHGRRKGTFGALLLASYNSDLDVYESVCKLGSGFSDENLAELPSMFHNLMREEKPVNVSTNLQPDVWIYPEKVIEIVGAEITVSPVHTCANNYNDGKGLAVRFPRFIGNWRKDKKAEDATSSFEIFEMYKNQKKSIVSEE